MNQQVQDAYTTALLRSLHFSGVKFLRFLTVDVCNNIRCKVKPVDSLLRSPRRSLGNQVSVAAVCYAGLPYYADSMIEGTGMTARDVLAIDPDLSTFRVLPYAKQTALVIGNLNDQYTGSPSPLCSRNLLQRVIRNAAEQHNIGFAVGVELEFCLVDIKTGAFVDESVFANSVTLNDNEEFFSELYDQLKQQYIPVELIHSESGPGQLEIVLEYSPNNAVEMADNVLLTRETIRCVARKHGMKALFAPKYDASKAGNGMHVHMSLVDPTTCKPVFANGASLTNQGAAFIEGVLQHIRGLMGLSLPTVNSHRRVGKGCWTGSVVGWALEDKECAVRVCSSLSTKEWTNVEYKLCDSTCNLYLALAGVLSAGLDGISQNLSLRPALEDGTDPVVVNPPLPGTVTAALDALEEDELLQDMLGHKLSRGYLALRRNEAERNKTLTLVQEVAEFLARA